MNKRTTKRALTITLALAAVLALAGLLGTTACSQSPEQAARESLARELDNLKKPDSPLFQLAGRYLGGIEQLGVDQNELSRVWFDGYAYEIGEINVVGDLAVAQVEITGKQPGPALSPWRGQADGSTGDDPARAQAAEALVQRVQAAPVDTVSIGVALRKDNNTWVVDTEGQWLLAQAIAGALPNE